MTARRARRQPGPPPRADIAFTLDVVVVDRSRPRHRPWRWNEAAAARPAPASGSGCATRRTSRSPTTPGVGRVAARIAAIPGAVGHLTGKNNRVAIVTDVTAVLGLGDLGPAAALPVMEGKAALFAHLADIDAVPICLDTADVETVVATVTAIAPSFGGVNLEDIAAPRSFEIEARLRAALDIPVLHDDQHGTAVVVLAALRNALTALDKRLETARVVVLGAGTAVTRLLLAAGARDVIVWAPVGVLGPRLAASLPRTSGRWPWRPTRAACAAAWPAEIAGVAAVIATGRSGHPNQVNNALVFPGLFRGALDAHVRALDTPVLLACAQALTYLVPSPRADRLLPDVLDPRVVPAVAAAVTAGAARVPEPPPKESP